MYYIYMVKCTDGSLYTGITNSLAKRMKEHYYKKANCAKYTKSHQVSSLEALWQVEEKGQALKIERMIKSLSRKEKDELLENHNIMIELIDEKELDINAKSIEGITIEELLGEDKNGQQ